MTHSRLCSFLRDLGPLSLFFLTPPPTPLLGALFNRVCQNFIIMLDYCSGWKIMYSERRSDVPLFKFQIHSHDVSTMFTKCSHGMS